MVTAIKKFKGRDCVFIKTKLVIEPTKNDETSMKAVSDGKVIFDYKNGVIVGVNNTLGLKLEVYKFINKRKVLFTSLVLKMINKLSIEK